MITIIVMFLMFYYLYLGYLQYENELLKSNILLKSKGLLNTEKDLINRVFKKHYEK